MICRAGQSIRSLKEGAVHQTSLGLRCNPLQGFLCYRVLSQQTEGDYQRRVQGG